MGKQLSQQEIIDSTTLQLALLAAINELLKPSFQERRQTVTTIFAQFDLDRQQGLITQETQERLIDLWIDNYLPIDNPESDCRN